MTLQRERQISYFMNSLRYLPGAYSKLDTNRLTIVHFAVHALDLLGVWSSSDDSLFELHNLTRHDIIEWIYSLQTVDTCIEVDIQRAGFKGGSFLGIPVPEQFDHGHVAMTYTALATLQALGDDLTRVNKSGILSALRNLQQDDGSFQCVSEGSENDMRFLYCACAVCHMLQDWSPIDIDKALMYVQSCHSWDGAFGLLPGQEGHGGSTFCAVASLVLMGHLDSVLTNENGWRDDLISWCTSRQIKGMQGRPGKLEDTCYSYWIGGTLRLLGEDSLLNHQELRAFVFRCQTQFGGFGKVVGAMPDILHSFYSLAYLSLSQSHFDKSDDDCNPGEYDLNLRPLNCTLGICQDRAEAFGPVNFP